MNVPVLHTYDLMEYFELFSLSPLPWHKKNWLMELRD